MQNKMSGMNMPQMQNNGISSQTVSPQINPQTGYNNDMFYQMEQAIGADFQKLKDLVQKGTITETEGQYLLGQLARKAQEINTYKNSIQSGGVVQTKPLPASEPLKNPMDMFNEENPGFFAGEGRIDVLNYIKGLDMDKDEIFQISQLVEKLENSAVDKYLKRIAYEKTLNDENAAAKSKLTSYAQNTTSDGNMTKVFTREDIGNMSGDEFTQNEKAIMEQLKQGLIK